LVLTFCDNLLDWPNLFDPPLLALAVLICALGSYTVFVCLGRALLAPGRGGWPWLGAICISFGADIWAAHFIAMLSYMPALPYSYDFGGSVGSMLVAVFGGAVSFAYVILRPASRLGPWLAGIGLGLTIAVMHFIGMNAMNTGGSGATSPVFSAAGLLAAVVMSGLAIVSAGRRSMRYHIVLASFCLMAAVFGCYFTTMGGFSLTKLTPLVHTAYSGQLLLAVLVNTESLALAIAGASGVLLIATFGAAMTDRRIGVLQAHEADKLRHQMRHDETTGLPNRLFLRECLAEVIEASGGGCGFAVLILDLDRFKPVNDLYGREIGDRLLCLAAERMQFSLGAADITARIGADKFVILHHSEMLPAGAVALAERLIQTLQEPFAVDEHSVVTGAGVGIAVYPAEGATAEALLRDAETALNFARAQGGGQPCLFEADMRREREARRELEHDFRLAIADRQFAVHYQPLFESDTLALSGFEALARWQHPARGLVGPAEFIPFAEKSGLITPLGQWVLETACADAAHWPEHLRISINISAVQLRAGELIGSVSTALQKTGLPAHRLELEVTEGALIENPLQARWILTRLKEMGVQITLDDFGTGYSSLSYLRHFTFDRIKIDRSFIENLEADPESLLIVRAIVDLAHSLRAGVLAEGIETAGQLRLLRQQSCDQLQGYLLGRPEPIAGAAALVNTHARTAARLANHTVVQLATGQCPENLEPVAQKSARPLNV
jgi:diguanylate cyclase